MSTLDQILGREPVKESVLPVMTGRTRPASMLRREAPEDKEESKLKKKARQSSVVASIIGMAENEEESIIPDNAKQVDAFASPNIPGMGEVPSLDGKNPAEPSFTVDDEELIQPSAALVAPDITPKVFELIDPSQVPVPPRPSGQPPGPPTVTPMPTGAAGALDTILGRQHPNPAPNAPPPVAVESFLHSINPGDIKSRVAEKLIPGQSGGFMPEHKEGDGQSVYNAFRTFIG